MPVGSIVPGEHHQRVAVPNGEATPLRSELYQANGSRHFAIGQRGEGCSGSKAAAELVSAGDRCNRPSRRPAGISAVGQGTNPLRGSALRAGPEPVAPME
jgi:hypothetical protein